MITEVQNLFISRKSEIEDAIKLLEELEKKTASVRISAIQKAAITLMLYNLVEGEITLVFTILFDHITKVENFCNLSDKMKTFLLRYHCKRIGNEEDLLDFMGESKNAHHISYDDYRKKIKLFSGNLDGKEIREVLEKIGLKLNGSKEFQILLKIKELRNDLAHGKCSYLEAGRNYTITDIKDISRNVFKCLASIQKQFNDYIEQQKYMMS